MLFLYHMLFMHHMYDLVFIGVSVLEVAPTHSLCLENNPHLVY